VEVVERGPQPADPLAGIPLVEEHEPDDDRDHAQPIEAGKGIRGSLAPPTRLGAGKGDDDWYSYLVQDPSTSLRTGPAGGDGVRELQVRLLPGPGADVALEIMDGDGRRMVLADEGRAGAPEEARGLTLALGQTIYLRVRPSPKAGPQKPADDQGYRLAISHTTAPPGSEVEPNDTPAQATAMTGPDANGTLARKKDEDWFAWPLPAGDGGVMKGTILRLELSGPGVGPEVRLLPAPDAGPLLVARAPSGADELRLRNVGLPEGARQLLIGISSPGLRRGSEGRYQLRLAIEPPLQGAEQEPNDTCERASRLAAPGEIAGFLWPGDVDCYQVAAAPEATISLRLQGDGCQADLLLPGERKAEGGAAEIRWDGSRASQAPGSAGRDPSPGIQVRVVPRSRTGCFDAPYRLLAQVRPGAP
jgi:hypothetical protein